MHACLLRIAHETLMNPCFLGVCTCVDLTPSRSISRSGTIPLANTNHTPCVVAISSSVGVVKRWFINLFIYLLYCFALLSIAFAFNWILLHTLQYRILKQIITHIRVSLLHIVNEIVLSAATKVFTCINPACHWCSKFLTCWLLF